MAAGGVAFSFLTPPIVRAQTAESAPGPYSDLNTESPASPAWISERFEGGIRYTQDGKNYFVVSGEIQRAFEDQGGEAVWGRPVSGAWRGKDYQWAQAFVGGVFLVKDGKSEQMNILDDAKRFGYDAWLEDNYQIPPAQEWPSDQGQSWEDIVQSRLAITDPYPALTDFILGDENWVNKYGLPVSIGEYEGGISVRMQRAGIKLLKNEAAGPKGVVEIDVVGGGTIAREATMYGRQQAGLEPLIPYSALFPRPFEIALGPAGKFESKGDLSRGFGLRRYYKGDKLEIDIDFASPEAEQAVYQFAKPRLGTQGRTATSISLTKFDDPILKDDPLAPTLRALDKPTYTPIFKMSDTFGYPERDTVTGQDAVSIWIGFNEGFFLNEALYKESVWRLRDPFIRNIGQWATLGLIIKDDMTSFNDSIAFGYTRPLVVRWWPKGHPEDVRILPP